MKRTSSFYIDRPSSNWVSKGRRGNPVDGRITLYTEEGRFPLLASNDADHSDRDRTVSTIITKAGYGELLSSIRGIRAGNISRFFEIMSLWYLTTGR